MAGTDPPPMDQALTALDANRVLVQFLYGEAFFMAALAIALRLNRQSSFRLAEVIWLFAAFAVLHGLSEWGEVFIPIQRSYLPAQAVAALHIVQIALVGVSFVLLFQFGAELLARLRPRAGWTRMLPIPLALGWGFSLLLGATFYATYQSNFASLALLTARLFLLLPAATLTFAALILEARDPELAPFPGIARSLRWAGVCVLGWAAVAETAPSLVGLVSRSGYALLEPLLVAAAIPAGLGVAYFITRAMEVFVIEQRRQMEAMERRHLVLIERERIGHELHDGVTQVLYAIGMQAQAGLLRATDKEDRALLESLSALARRGLTEVRTTIEASSPHLAPNESIEDAIRALPQEYAPVHGPTLELTVAGSRPPLPPAVEAALYRIAREAFFNACRHGGASHIAVALEFSPDEARIRVEDNGLGISEAQKAAALGRAGHFGLAGLAERLAPWHGTLGVRRRPEGGTEVAATIPLPRAPSTQAGRADDGRVAAGSRGDEAAGRETTW